MITSSITATDGVTLAVHSYTDFDPARPTVRAVETGPAVLPVAAESWIGYAMRRISPSMVRLLARFDIRQK